MFYYIDLIGRRQKFGLIWMAAFDRADYNKFETKIVVRDWNIENSCEDVLKFAIEGRRSSPRMNLYVTSTLLFGIVKIFREKVNMVYNNALQIFTKWGDIISSLELFTDQESEWTSFIGYVNMDDDEDFTNLPRHYLQLPKADLEEITLVSQEKEKTWEILQDSAVIDGDELIEILRRADASMSPKTTLEHPDITMRENQMQEEIVAEEKVSEKMNSRLSLSHSEIFEFIPVGVAPQFLFLILEEPAVNISDLLPVVQDILLDKEPLIEPATVSQLVPPPEELDVGEIQLHPDDQSVAQMEVGPQLPTIVVEREEDVNPPADAMDIADIDRVIQELIVPEDEILPERVERQIPKPKTNIVTSLSHRQLQERENNFSNLLRCQIAEDDSPAFKEVRKTKKVPDWIIPEILKPYEGLNPPRKWPPAQLEHLITIRMFDDKLQEDTVGGLMDAQTLRDGDEIDVSMGRRSLGSPTPKTQPKEAHKSSRSSLSPLGLQLRSFAEINPMLEPITEATLPGVDIITSELLEEEEINVPFEEILPVQPTLPREEPLLAEEAHLPSSPKRPRLELSSDESSVTLPISYGDVLMKKLLEYIATNQEPPSFHKLFPPSCTTKRAAAYAFTSLLNLGKSKLIRTEQRAAFEDIFIFPSPFVDVD